MAYAYGLGVTHNAEKAVELFQQATEAGGPRAMYNLGFAYSNGWGIAKDRAKAIDLFVQASNAGIAEAMNSLGVLYSEGRNYSEAVDLFEQASKAGIAEATRNLGIEAMLDVEALQHAKDKGECSPDIDASLDREKSKAVNLFRQAAEAGIAEAMYRLGVIYFEDRQEDKEKGKDLIGKAAAAGNKNASDYCWRNLTIDASDALTIALWRKITVLVISFTVLLLTSPPCVSSFIKKAFEKSKKSGDAASS